MAGSPFKAPVSKFAIAHGVVKLVAIACGLVLSQLCLMATVGLVTESGWIRTLVGLAVNLLVPLALVDRVLPKDDPTRSKGLASDVLALVWLGFPFLFIVAGQIVTGPMLAREAGRLEAVGLEGTAWVAYNLAGVDPDAPRSDAPAAGPAASASAALSASAPPGGSAAPSASVAASASAPLAASAPPSASAVPPPPGPEEMTPAELFKKLSPSVVTISFSAAAGLSGGGTGFLIDDEGTIATNHHVISSAKQLRIKFANGALFQSVELLAENPDRDLALLRIKLDEPEEGSPKVEAEPLDLGDSDAVVVGERAVAIGNPLGLEHTLTDGLISSRRMYQGKPWIQMSVPVSPGNSGGPLFNLKGEVIGVITAQILGGFGGRAQNLNLAVPVNALKEMVHDKYPNRRPFGAPGGSSHW